MLNSFKIKTKNLFCSIILALGILLTAFTGFNIVSSNNNSVVSAAVDNKITKDVTSSVFSSSYNFSTTSTSKPVKPSGWTEITNGVVNEGNIIRGIVDVKEESSSSFDTEVYKTTKPNMNDQTSSNSTYYKNLMINSPDNTSGRFGYESSNSFKLEADSFYAISVYLYTQKTSDSETLTDTDAKASIYLTDLIKNEKDENYKQTYFEYFSTLGNWQSYTFYVDTNEAVSPKMQLWLGSKDYNCQGAVFFNEIKVTRFSEDRYNEIMSTITDTDTNNFNIISLSKNYTQPFDNSDFENSFTSWNQKAFSSETTQVQRIVNPSTITTINSDLIVTTPGSNCSPDNYGALFMYNEQDGYQAIESQSITFDAHKYYKLSFWAKSDCNTGSGATVMLIDKSENNKISDAKLTLSTNFTKDSNTFRNDWTQYNFYICGPATQTKQAAIQVWLGTTDSKTSGYVFVDDFRLYEIDYSTFNSNSSSTNSTALNYNNTADKYTVANGTFDKTENTSNTLTYPLKPASWEKSGTNNVTNSTTFSGVINASNNTFSNTIIENLPLSNDNDNNVLMIGSLNKSNTQSYVSSDITLESNNYYVISLYVITDYTPSSANDNSGARITISSSSKTLFDFYNVHYNTTSWQKVSVYIKTGTIAETANIKLSFDGYGFVFFDEVRLLNINEGLFTEATAVSKQTYKIDLTTENFDNRTFNKYPTTLLQTETPNNWTGSEANNVTNTVTTGIINADNDLINSIAGSLSGNKNYLYISAHEDVNYTYTSKDSYTFDAGTYYRISVNILTRYLSLDKEYEEEFINGASIKLSGSESIYLSGINSNNQWKTYYIYMYLDSSITSASSLSLGYIDQPTSGDVLFDNLVISTIADKATYEAEVNSLDDDQYATFINYSENTDPDPSDTSSSWSNSIDQIMIIVPSIIT